MLYFQSLLVLSWLSKSIDENNKPKCTVKRSRFSLPSLIIINIPLTMDNIMK